MWGPEGQARVDVEQAEGRAVSAPGAEHGGQPRARESGVGKGLIGSHQWDSLARGGLARPGGPARGLQTGLALLWPCQLQADTVCRGNKPRETTARLR